MSVFSGTYVSANTFEVTGDQRAHFLPDRAVTINCGGTWVYVHIDVSVYTTVTTVTLLTSVLTDPISDVYVGIHPQSIPIHAHEDDSTGGTGVVGTPPDHEWNGSEIRFRKPDGSWGTWSDLAGVAMEWQGAWALSTSYLLLDGVAHNGSSYVCILAHTADASSEPGVGTYWATYWGVLAEKGDVGAPLAWEGAWVLSTAYSALDTVENNGSSYVCILAHTSSTTDGPGTGTYWATYWDLMAEKGDNGTSFVWQGPWALSTAYVAPDTVENNGSSYICILGHTASATDEPGVGTYWATYWDIVAEKGDQGIQGSQGIQGPTGTIWDWQGPWVLSTAYLVDEGVENNGSSYICTTAHTSSATDEPGVGTYWATYWDMVAEKGDTGVGGSVHIGTMDGRLSFVSAIQIKWEFLESNQVALYNAAWELVSITSEPTAANSATDVNGDTLTYDLNYDVFLVYSSATVATLAFAKWASATAISAAWVDSTAYKIGQRVSYGGHYYFCILAHTSDLTTRPSDGVYWETYWINNGTIDEFYQLDGVAVAGNNATYKKYRHIGEVRLFNNSGAKFAFQSNKMFIRSKYNPEPLYLGLLNSYTSDVIDTSATLSNSTPRSWNNNGDDWKIEFLSGGRRLVKLEATAQGYAGSASGFFVSIGLDGKTPHASSQPKILYATTDNIQVGCSAKYSEKTTKGYHYFYPLAWYVGGTAFAVRHMFHYGLIDQQAAEMHGKIWC